MNAKRFSDAANVSSNKMIIQMAHTISAIDSALPEQQFKQRANQQAKPSQRPMESPHMNGMSNRALHQPKVTASVRGKVWRCPTMTPVIVFWQTLTRRVRTLGTPLLVAALLLGLIPPPLMMSIAPAPLAPLAERAMALLPDIAVAHAQFTCPNNLLQNPSFENGNSGDGSPVNWSNGTASSGTPNNKPDGNFYGYASFNPVMYQDVSIIVGTGYSMTFYSGAHDIVNQTVEIQYYDASNSPIGTTDVHNITYDVDPNDDFGGPYSLSLSAAPANASLLRVSVDAKGDPFAKVDALCLEVATAPEPPSLTITKSDDGIGPVSANDTIPYTIVIANTSGGTATSVVVTDTLPAGLSYVANSSQVTYPSSSSSSVTLSNPSPTPPQTFDGDNTTPLQFTFNSTGLVPAGATLASVGFTTSGESINGSFRSEIGLQITTPGGGSASWDFGNDLGQPGNDGTYNSATATSSSVSGSAEGTFTVAFTESFDDNGVDDNRIDSLALTVTYNTSSNTTQAAGAAPNLITAADGIDLQVGETMTVTFQATVDDPVTVTEFTNRAYATSSNLGSTVTASDNTVAIQQTTLTVAKVVLNDDGTGSSVAGDFTLTIDGGTPINVGSGVANVVTPGSYTVSESGPSGYTATFSGDCDASGQVTLSVGDTLTCTITNDDLPTGTITIVKHTVGSDGTFTYSSADADLDGLAIATIANTGSSTTITKTIGVYTITEDALPATWSLTSVSIGGTDTGTASVADQANSRAVINLDEGDAVVITFTNTEQADPCLDHTTNNQIAISGVSSDGDAATGNSSVAAAPIAICEEYDYGDLPDADSVAGTNSPSYNTDMITTLTNIVGASHVITPGLYLGALVDNEADGQPSIDATGDDTITGTVGSGVGVGTADDEDGVTLPAFAAGATASVVVSVVNTTGATAYVYGFIDFDGDGAFTTVGEVVSTTAATSGTVTLPFNVPSDADTTQRLGARFRLSTDTGLDADGTASNGEVEDYLIEIAAAGSLALKKMLTSPADGVAAVGETVTFTLQITNTGLITVAALNLSDTYDATTLQYSTASITPDAQTAGNITWAGDYGASTGSFLPNLPLAPGASFSITVEFIGIAPTKP